MILFLFLILALGSGASAHGKYKGLDNVKGLKELMKNLSNDFYATCQVALFATPKNYKNAEKECKDFRLGGKNKRGNLVTLDSKMKTTHAEFLFDMGVPAATEVNDSNNWLWTGLRKVSNTEVQGKKKKEVKKYDPNEWEWVGTGHSPVDYNNWPGRRSKYAQPDQLYLKKKKGRNGCYDDAGCYQNQVRFGGHTLLSKPFWDDAWDFEKHPFACDYDGRYIISNTRLTWQKAVKACEKAGLTLAMVRNNKEVQEMKEAIEYFLGPADETWDIWDPENWVWLGGNDLKKEGVFRWLNGKPVDKWDVPWMRKAGGDNAAFLKETDGQHAIAFARWGVFDDSYHGHKTRSRPFACQCPDS